MLSRAFGLDFFLFTHFHFPTPAAAMSWRTVRVPLLPIEVWIELLLEQDFSYFDLKRFGAVCKAFRAIVLVCSCFIRCRGGEGS